MVGVGASTLAKTGGGASRLSLRPRLVGRVIRVGGEPNVCGEHGQGAAHTNDVPCVAVLADGQSEVIELRRGVAVLRSKKWAAPTVGYAGTRTSEPTLTRRGPIFGVWPVGPVADDCGREGVTCCAAAAS